MEAECLLPFFHKSDPPIPALCTLHRVYKTYRICNYLHYSPNCQPLTRFTQFHKIHSECTVIHVPETLYLFVRSLPQVHKMNNFYFGGYAVSSHMSHLKLLIGYRLKLVLKIYTANFGANYILSFRVCENKFEYLFY